MKNFEKVNKAAMVLLAMQRYSWEQGVAGHAFIDLEKDDVVEALALSSLYRVEGDGRVAAIGSEHAATDPITPGESLVYAYEKTGKKLYKDAIDKLLDWSLNKVPRTFDGTVYHIDNRNHVMSDATYMLPPFLVAAGYYKEAVKEIDGLWKYLYSKENKMLSHIWDDDKKAFEREAYWGGGNGWALASIARMLKKIPQELTAERENLIAKFVELLDACIACMLEDGSFYDVLDDSTTFVETNFGQMCAYAIYTGVRCGWLDAKYISYADKMREYGNSKLDDLGCSQDVASMPRFDRAGISSEGQAFYIMMEVAADKYYNT